MLSSVADAHTNGRPERCTESTTASATTLWNSPAKAWTLSSSSLWTAAMPASGRPCVSSNKRVNSLLSTPPEPFNCCTARVMPSLSSRPAQGMPGNVSGPSPPIRIVSFSFTSVRLMSSWLTQHIRTVEGYPFRIRFARRAGLVKTRVATLSKSYPIRYNPRDARA